MALLAATSIQVGVFNSTGCRQEEENVEPRQSEAVTADTGLVPSPRSENAPMMS